MPLENWIFAAVVVLGLPVCLYVVWVGRLAGKYEDWIYLDVSDAELPLPTSKYFQRTERNLIAIGFKRVATCLQRPKPKLTYVRHLIHATDRRVFATIDDIHYPLSRTQAFSYISVLEDGLFLETSALDMPLPEPGTDKLRFVLKPGAAADKLLETHFDAVREAEAERGSRAIVFEPQQYRDVTTYGHRLAAWDMYHKGIKHEPPTALPELVAR